MARGADVLGMAGGDGSQALVASVAAHHGVPFVVCRRGPGTISRSTSASTVTTWSARSTLSVTASSNTSTSPRSTGGSSSTTRRLASTRGSSSHPSTATRSDRRPSRCSRSCSGRTRPAWTSGSSVLTACRARRPTSSSCSNNPYELDRIAGRGTRERLDRGQLGIATVAIDDARAAAKLVTLELAGQMQRFEGWLEWTAQRFEVAADEPVEVGVDGEALRMDPPLVFESLPGVLCVRLPRTAGGRSPAARAVHLASRSTVAALGRIAGGHDPTAGTAGTEGRRAPEPQ